MARQLVDTKDPYTGGKIMPVMVPGRLVIEHGMETHPRTKKWKFAYQALFKGYRSLEAAISGAKPVPDLTLAVTNLTPGHSTDQMTSDYFQTAAKSLFDLGMCPAGASADVIAYCKSTLGTDVINELMWKAAEAKLSGQFAGATNVVLTGGPNVDPAAAIADVPWLTSK